jgi:hypothetical protein
MNKKRGQKLIDDEKFIGLLINFENCACDLRDFIEREATVGKIPNTTYFRIKLRGAADLLEEYVQRFLSETK